MVGSPGSPEFAALAPVVPRPAIATAVPSATAAPTSGLSDLRTAEPPVCPGAPGGAPRDYVEIARSGQRSLHQVLRSGHQMCEGHDSITVCDPIRPVSTVLPVMSSGPVTLRRKLDRREPPLGE